MQRIQRVQKHRPAQFLALGPDRIKRLLVEVLLVDVCAHVKPAHAGEFGRAREFLQSERRRLHGDYRHADEALGVLNASFGAGVVVDLRQL